MKLARFDEGKTGLIVERHGELHVIDVVATLSGVAADQSVRETLGALLVCEHASWLPLIRDWLPARATLRALEASALDSGEGIVTRALQEVTLQPPLPDRASRVFAIGANFRDHVKTAGNDDLPPWGFFVIPGTIVGTGALITPPPWVQKLDYEAEVAIVLGSGGANLSPDNLDVWGYTGWNDLSIRDGSFGLRTIDAGPRLNWALQKNFTSSNPCGPWLVVDEPLVGKDVHFSSRINGERRQASSTAEMIHGFGAIAEWLSAHLALEPGDVLLSGTSGGTAVESGIDGPFLRDGDIVEVEVEGIGGVLKNEVHFPVGGA